MSRIPDDDAFQRFVVQREKDLKRIARATRGDCRFGDVVNESWLMASHLQTKEGEAPDLSDADCQHRLLSHLYQHLVRYTEQTVRHAVRLDHAPKGREDDGDAHPLGHLLASNEERGPVEELCAREIDSALESSLAAHGSLAAAYVYLLRRFDNNMSAVADHLRISRSYAYRCCANARWLAAHVTHIPAPVVGHFILRPWRGFRLRRPHVQLAFNFFDDELLL